MPKILYDASVYIQAWREKRLGLFTSRAQAKSFVYFSCVVGSELLRGARDAGFRNMCRKVWKDFRKANRLVVPTDNDWLDAAATLNQIAQHYGYEEIGLARLAHDTLIGIPARRLGISVVTLNIGDFQRIAEFRPFSLLSALDLGP
jgi:predicted nucleic acid-binding protein